jgi:hypothetical protein
MCIEDSNLVRTKATQDKNLDDLKNKKAKTVHEKGVKSDSCLNQLSYFESTKGLPPDIMHDMLEGVIRYNFCCLMEYLSDSKL